MESASVTAGRGGVLEEGIEDKGLKSNAIGFISSTVIGVASVAPGYSLAATLGLVAGVVGFQAPAVMLLAFIPMFCIAYAYKYMNRADPDCGTTFAWGTRALGPATGWMGGWAIIVADIIVMANLAQIAGSYTFQLIDVNASTTAVTAVGVLWIIIMTAIVTIGIELSARTQVFLLGAEILTLAAFSITALVKVYVDSPAGSHHVDASWFSPFAIPSWSALTSGVLLAVFIYWGWDTAVSVNEETEDRARAPGRAAVVSTLILLGIYVIVSVAAEAFAGTKVLVDNPDDVLGILGGKVFGSPLDKIVIIAVLTSAAASTQTTILPTARTTLSMARWDAIPKSLGRVHPRYLTPHISTILMGAVSIVWYVGLTIVSENILFDSIAAIGLMIAFYYGMTGVACAVYFRHELRKSFRNFFMAGILPLVGAAILGGLFIKNCVDLSDPKNSSVGKAWLGLGPPLVIGIGSLLLGAILMAIPWIRGAPFFRRRLEVATPGLLEEDDVPPRADVMPPPAPAG